MEMREWKERIDLDVGLEVPVRAGEGNYPNKKRGL